MMPRWDGERFVRALGDQPDYPNVPVLVLSARADDVLRENLLDADAETLRGYDRSAEATFSPHLWRGTLPTDLSVGAHRIEVRAFDPWRGEVRAQGDYRLQTAE